MNLPLNGNINIRDYFSAYDEIDGDISSLIQYPALDLTTINEYNYTVTVKNKSGNSTLSAFATSSTIVAKVIGENPDITSIICGGDTTGFVENLMEESKDLKYSLVSTGGGASLELLCGKELPGLEVVEDK